MLRKIALFAIGILVVVGSFILTNLMFDRGFAATLLTLYRFVNP